MTSKYITGKITGSLLLCLFSITMTTNVKAQQQAFSYTQFMDNLTPLNPAYSLLDSAGSINALARRQWVGVDGSPTTYLFNADVPLSSIKSAAGLIVENDAFAIERQTEVNAYFARSARLGLDAYLGVSLNVGIRSYVADYASLTANDPVFATNIRQTKPNVGFGVMYYSSWGYLGVSVPELTITSLGTASLQDNSNFRNHYYFSGALITQLAQDIEFKPAVLFSYEKGIPLTADFSGLIYFKDILGVGADFRTTSEMALIMTINFDSFHIGYSYQFGTSDNDLGGFNLPTHEVTLSYRFGAGASKPKLL